MHDLTGFQRDLLYVIATERNRVPILHTASVDRCAISTCSTPPFRLVPRRHPMRVRRLASLATFCDSRETVFRGRCAKSRAMRIRTSVNYEYRLGLHDDVETLLDENMCYMLPNSALMPR